MFNKLEFNAALARKDVKKSELAKVLGINEATLYRKINNDGFFTRDEINKIIKYLEIENPRVIFFADELT